MIEAQPFLWEFRCLGRIVPATDTLGNHSALLFVFELAQVIKNEYKMGALSFHSKHYFLESNPASPSFVVAFVRINERRQKYTIIKILLLEYLSNGW